MADQAPAFLAVGHLSKPHGTRGEIFVWPLTDHPGSTFVPGVVLRLGDESGDRPDPFHPPVTVATVRPFKQGYLVGLAGIDSRSEAERVTGRYLLRPLDETQPLSEGEVFHHDLLKMAVVTADGRSVGRVVDVYELDPADLIEVEDSDGRLHLIPFTRQFVRELDAENRRIVVDLPEGLLDL